MTRCGLCRAVNRLWKQPPCVSQDPKALGSQPTREAWHKILPEPRTWKLEKTALITHQGVDALVRQIVVGGGIVLNQLAILDEVALADLVDLREGTTLPSTLGGNSRTGP